jgi:hypothetical protein
MGGSELAPDSSTGPGDARDDRLKLADMDPDTVQNHTDLMRGIGEIGENCANEANFDETTRIVEVQGPIQVTANCAAVSALDKRAD